MAKPKKETTEASTEAKKSHTGVYIVGALVAVVLAVGLYFSSVDTAADPDAPKANPELSALMEAGPLEDIVLGDPNADNVIVEYASMTCPHCAHFYTEVFPTVKEKYIDTGKARFIFREFPLDSLAARASMLARCAGNDRFYPLIDGLFETQETWAAPGPDGQEKLKLIAKQAGFSEESYKQCVEDKDLFNKIVAVRKKAHEEFGVDGTPAFFVNGTRLEGVGIESFDAAIEGKPETPPSG
ncbi:DsbA family protein [Methyloceanibacter caenitepidi]|uniref:Periplasmic thiol:disulfide interchange protein DsbA n=1 Tax=Methyloceanibacter caenitepidi TaxID=1384459 RepID=A0A0A8K0P7_9HYPH|nr:DsbA family protein [Methyloceanibacter caenitepidi]BAQ16475.1 periplasmic thiol:disulfide interchange protein DsbA [Methyloceanibacter caenitepidi]